MVSNSVALQRPGVVTDRPLGPFGIPHPCGNSALDCQLLRHTENIGVDPLVGFALVPVEPPSAAELAVRPADEEFWAANDAAFRCPAQDQQATAEIAGAAAQLRRRYHGSTDHRDPKAPRRSRPLKALDPLIQRVRAVFAPRGQKLCGLVAGDVAAGLGTVTDVVNAGGAGQPAPDPPSANDTAPLDVVLTEGGALRLAGWLLGCLALALAVFGAAVAFSTGAWPVNDRRRRSLAGPPEGAAGAIGAPAVFPGVV